MLDARSEPTLSTLYRESGKHSWAGLAFALAGASAASAILAIAYIAGFRILPSILAHVVLCAGFGVGVGMASCGMLRLGKCRSRAARRFVVALASAIAMLLAWDLWVYQLLASDPQAAIPLERLLSRPDVLWQSMARISATGVWSMFSAKKLVNGPMLWACWVAELLLFGVGVLVAYRRFPLIPFCEACGKWCTRKKLLPGVAVPNILESMPDADRLANGDLAPLAGRPSLRDDDPYWLEVESCRCPTCANSVFLTVCLGQFIERFGRTNARTTVLIPYAVTTAERVDDLERAIRLARHQAEEAHSKRLA